MLNLRIKIESRAIGLALANPPASASDMADPSLSKFTPRAEGALLREWVARLGGGCGVKILEVAATSGASAPRTSGDRPRHDADSERNTRGGFNPRKVSNGRGGGRGGDRDAGRLVEKVYNGPPLGGNGMGKIRLLARGEKLDP